MARAGGIQEYKKRTDQLLNQIKHEAALLPAAPQKYWSRDLLYPYRQESDFLYFTGLDEPNSCLLLLGRKERPRSILFVPQRDPERERWDGEMLGLDRAKQLLEVDAVFPSSDFDRIFRKETAFARKLHYSPGLNPATDELVWSMMKRPVFPPTAGFVSISDLRLLTSRLRWIKSDWEIRQIRKACTLTAETFSELVRSIRPDQSEQEVARSFECLIADKGASGVSFPTIVASGANATVLHHKPSAAKIGQQGLLLVDAGARLHGYCGDVTRCYPLSGKFSSSEADIYDLVQLALEKAIQKAGIGKTLQTVHQAALKVLVSGLIELKVIKASLDEALEKQLYKPWFMHNTSHWLGIDVHDASPVGDVSSGTGKQTPSNQLKLQEGCVFTVEPGLYFGPSVVGVPKRYAGIGIRLEQDVLVTSSRTEVMTSLTPVKRQDVQEIAGRMAHV